MIQETRYYCPICLMDTGFRVVGREGRKVYICSDCSVEFMQEPQQPMDSTPVPPGGSPSGGSPSEADRAQRRNGDSGRDRRGAVEDDDRDVAWESPRDLDEGRQRRVIDDGRPTVGDFETSYLEPVREAGDEPRSVAPRTMRAERIELEDAGPRALHRKHPSIGVLGPTSGGKSIYIARLIDRLSRAPIRLENGLSLYTTPFEDVESWSSIIRDILVPLKHGRWPANTPRPQSRTVDVLLRGRPAPDAVKKKGLEGAGFQDFHLRFLDCAGETLLTWLKNQRKKLLDPQFDPLFESEEMTATYDRIDGVMRSSRGLMLLVSPEHSPTLRRSALAVGRDGKRRDESERAESEGAALLNEDFAAYFFQYLFDFQRESGIKYNLAIIFTKYDRFRSLIDPDHVEDFARSYFPQMDNTLQGFFEGQYRYFAVSSVGHVFHPLDLNGEPLPDPDGNRLREDGQPAPLAQPFGVEAPLLWLLEQLRTEGILGFDDRHPERP